MSALPKHRVSFEIHADSYEMLLAIAERYQLPDASKALRCLDVGPALDPHRDPTDRELNAALASAAPT